MLIILYLISYCQFVKANEAVKFSDTLINLIEVQEGYRAKSYKDLAGGLAIGYGHLIQPNEYKYLKYITRLEAEQLLIADLTKLKILVDKAIKVNLSYTQYDALYSLTYNIGIGTFLKSKLLKDINNEAGLKTLEQDFKSFTYYKKTVHSLTLKKRRDLEWYLWKPNRKTIMDILLG